MVLPSKITLLVEDQSDNLISDLIVYLELPVKKKNSYSIGPLKTDNKGAIIISNIDIITAVNKSLKDYPMDYSTSYEELSNLIKIHIYSIKELKNMSAAVEKYYPDTSNILNEQLKKCSNDFIHFKTTIDILVSNELIKINLFR